MASQSGMWKSVGKRRQRLGPTTLEYVHIRTGLADRLQIDLALNKYVLTKKGEIQILFLLRNVSLL